MSRIGRKPVAVPSGVTVEVTGSTVTVKGPKGTLTYAHLPEVRIALEEGRLVVARQDDTREARARHGLTRALLANMVQGVTQGFEKQLEVIGVGYKAQAKGTSVTLQLGFSHPIEYRSVKGVEIVSDEKNKAILIVRGIDREKVGQVAADIRSLRPPEPYKGKGIRYVGEAVRKKAGKSAVKGGAPGAAAA